MQSIIQLYKKLYAFFDKFEDHTRARLSRSPIIYAFIAGVSIVLFWRGVWHMADWFEMQGGILGFLFSAPVSLILTVTVMLATGLFISFFVGDVIIMSGLRHEKKIVDKTEEDLRAEEKRIAKIEDVLRDVREEVQHLHDEHSDAHEEAGSVSGELFDKK